VEDDCEGKHEWKPNQKFLKDFIVWRCYENNFGNCRLIDKARLAENTISDIHADPGLFFGNMVF